MTITVDMGRKATKNKTCMNFFLYKQIMFFIKETDTFGHVVVRTFCTSHIDHFTPQHTAFEKSTACLSVFLDTSCFDSVYNIQYCDTLGEL